MVIYTSGERATRVGCTKIAVVTIKERGEPAATCLAVVTVGAGVAVVTRAIHWLVHASLDGIAQVAGARVAIVASSVIWGV